VEALEAGADMLYVSGGSAQQERAYQAVLAAVRHGRISRRRLRISVERVLTLKRSYGLLPAPRPVRKPGLQQPKPAKR
jgi:beta-N-acetylhexosaminidase